MPETGQRTRMWFYILSNAAMQCIGQTIILESPVGKKTQKITAFRGGHYNYGAFCAVTSIYIDIHASCVSIVGPKLSLTAFCSAQVQSSRSSVVAVLVNGTWQQHLTPIYFRANGQDSCSATGGFLCKCDKVHLRQYHLAHRWMRL